MSEMPTLGEPLKQPTPVVPLAVTAVIVGCLTGGIYWVKQRPADASPPPPAAATPAPPEAVAPAAQAMAAPAVPTPARAAGQPTTPTQPGLKSMSARINGPLESAIVAEVGKDVGAPLTQVVNRSLVWWVRVPQDLVKGDSLSVVYEPRDGHEPVVHAVRFTSQKLGRTFEAYRFKPAAAAFPRYYQADGSELEERLSDPPLDSYEQITSLLRDGRRHKGVDFKTPIGTPVKATFDGVVTRKNWNFRGNGNSLELEEVGGQHRTALFLHLAEVPRGLEPGQRVKKGEVIAKSGNTGRSFAPHLHYQLMKGGDVVDPFDSHGSTRLALPSSERPAFEQSRKTLSQIWQ